MVHALSAKMVKTVRLHEKHILHLQEINIIHQYSLLTILQTFYLTITC